MLKTLFSKILGNENGQAVVAPHWEPIRHTFLKNDALAEPLHDKGYVVADRLDDSTLNQLRDLYRQLHNFNTPEGGMFYSVYSQDLDYRKNVHEGIAEVLKPVYDSLFKDYRSVLNSFIVKVAGPNSEFSLHQDSTGLDETKYSCLSVWIPLQDTDTHNGAMCVVPYSHRMFSPYRGISFPQPFDGIADTVRKYLQPINLKAGDVLLFDNRLVHNSVANLSDSDRIVVMSGIFPSEAKLLSVYKDPEVANSRIELIEQAEDYLLTYPNFFHDCHCRPETGHSVGFVDWDTSAVSEQQFVAMCQHYGLKEVNEPTVMQAAPNQAIIGEPISAGV